MRAVPLSLLLAALVACGSDPEPEDERSGVEPDKRLVEMNGDEATALCEYTVGLGPIAGDCSNGEYVMIGKLNVPDCLAQYQQRLDVFPMCTATVGDVEECTLAFLPFTAEQLCSDFVLPEPCKVIFTSECGGL